MRRRTLVIGCVVGAAFLSLCAVLAGSSLAPSTSLRLARHFDLADVSSTENIRAGLASRLPTGTAESAIYEFLVRSGIGKDRNSYFSPANEHGEIVCGVEYDGDLPEFVAGSDIYRITFRLDERGTLQAVEVTKSIMRL